MERVVLHSSLAQAPKLEPVPTVCCIQPILNDKLFLINFPMNLLVALRIAVQTSWNRGIQSEGYHDDKSSYQMKLRGLPWSFSDNHSQRVEESCRLMIGIMRFMLSHGWGLELSTHVDQRESPLALDSWFYKKQSQETHVVMCCIAFGSTDTIRVIDGSPEVLQAVSSAIEAHWHRGVQRQKIHNEVQEYKLKGRPWNSFYQKEKMHATALIMHLIDALRSVDWSLYASVATGSGYAPRLDTWILKKFRT